MYIYVRSCHWVCALKCLFCVFTWVWWLSMCLCREVEVEEFDLLWLSSSSDPEHTISKARYEARTPDWKSSHTHTGTDWRTPHFSNAGIWQRAETTFSHEERNVKERHWLTISEHLRNIEISRWLQLKNLWPFITSVVFLPHFSGHFIISSNFFLILCNPSSPAYRPCLAKRRVSIVVGPANDFSTPQV